MFEQFPRSPKKETEQSLDVYDQEKKPETKEAMEEGSPAFARLTQSIVELEGTLRSNDMPEALRNSLEQHVATLQEQLATAKAEHEAILDAAEIDELTKVLNRRGFMKQYTSRFDRISATSEHNTNFSLLYLDLDGFKKINDTLGHTVGDIALQVIAEQMEETLRETDTIGRLGGDEFAIILPQLSGVEARRVAERILESIRNTAGKILSEKYEDFPGVAASIGVVDAAHMRTESPDTDAEQLIEFADNRMYAAKAQKTHDEFGRPVGQIVEV